jgi:hypothetical protein
MKKIIIKLLCSRLGKVIIEQFLLPVIQEEITTKISVRFSEPFKTAFILYMQTEFLQGLTDKLVERLKK